jgi:gliding motility-associated-like protein
MKRLLLSYLFLSFFFNLSAQNLISNGSFEFIDSIPNNFYQIHFAKKWFGFSSDLYSLNSTKPNPYQINTDVSLPINGFGYQLPRTGNNVAGAICNAIYNPFGINQIAITETIEKRIETPLIGGEKYTFSMWVSPADSNIIAIDFISVFFSMDSLMKTDTTYPPLPFPQKYLITPQITHIGKGCLSDTMNWTLIQGDYTAQGGEQFIHLGGFVDSIDSTNYCVVKNYILGTPYLSFCYYFFDDISLYHSDTIPPKGNAGVDQTICWGDSVQIGSHSYSDYSYRWKAGLQSGFSPSMDSGRIWVAPKYTTTYVLECTDFRYEKSYDTITVKVELCGLSGKKHLNCTGDSLKLNDTLANFYSHLWTPDAFLSSDTLQSPICYAKSDIAYIHFTLDTSHNILHQDTIIVQVADCARAKAGSDTTICRFDSLQIGIENLPYFSYQWLPYQDLEWPYDGITTAWPTQSTEYILLVSDTLGNEATDTLNVKVKPCKLPPEIIIPNIFTPNGDNFNEVFRFKNEEYWHLKVEIYNRWGYLLFTGDENTHWDASFEGNKVSDGVYFYSIDAWVDGLDKVLNYKGSVTIYGK